MVELSLLSPCPLARALALWSFKQRGQPGKIRCKPPVREGAQVTTAPDNRSPGNHWQPQELRHCLASTQHSAGPLTCPVLKSPQLNAGQARLRAGGGVGGRAGRRAGFRTAGYGEHLPKFVDVDFKSESF